VAALPISRRVINVVRRHTFCSRPTPVSVKGPRQAKLASKQRKSDAA
jgi:hypothetical protein